MFTSMIHFSFFWVCLAAGLTVTFSLRLLNRNCNQPGLDNCKIYNCTDKPTVMPKEAPAPPGWSQVEVQKDKYGHGPVLNVTWQIQVDSSILRALIGTQINIIDQSSNQSLCVQLSYSLRSVQNPNKTKWTFSLDEVVVDFWHIYTVFIFNLPERNKGDYMIRKDVTIPGCDSKTLQKVQMCLENGSLWDPVPNIVDVMFVDRKPKMLLVVGFETSQYSEKYQVSIQNSVLHYSKNVSKEYTTWLNITFELDLLQFSQCEMTLMVQPFFIRCKNDCWSPKKTINPCQTYPRQYLVIKATIGLLVIGGFLALLLCRTSRKDPMNISSTGAREQPEIPVQEVQERKRVLIIYSLDHPLYKNVVLKFCAFLATKCGTNVVLDLLDSTRLGVLGSIQWLDWHKEQIENSSNKILILCSQGVQAKWRAMCGGKPVFLREDARSIIGDMLTPSLSLMVPHFIRSTSFKKYIVAYFDGVCSEDDIPSPFKIMVRYKLMKQFEEVFFRIQDIEKHVPGRMKHVDGLSEDKYHLCPTGKALHDAIEALRAYQMEHPCWFEEELLKSSEMEDELTSCEISNNVETIATVTWAKSDYNSHQNFTVYMDPEKADPIRTCVSICHTFEQNK
ncbi:interleukin-17 receptor A [Pholidichthys leucotaenia]